MSHPSVAHDLALKRTVHTPVEQKPHYAWRDVLAGETIALPPVVLLCPHGEERFNLSEVADTLGKALKGDRQGCDCDMGLSGRFSETSAKLTSAMMAWKKRIGG